MVLYRLAAACSVICASGAAVAAPARSRVVHGTITDRASHQPIDGAIVLSALHTVATAADGTFDISIGMAEHELTVTATGYGLRTIELPAGTAGSAADAALAIELDATYSEAIEITGHAPDTPAAQAQAHELTADTIRILPGSGDDILRAAQALPGVARLPYSFGGIVLRGSSPRDNEVYLDGIEVPLAFHFGGLTSFYPSNMLADMKIENGGFDAMYGRAQGGIVDLSSREPRADAWRLGGSVGLLDSGVWAEGPVGDGAIMFGVRRSYFDIVGPAFVPDDVPLPSYWDAQVKTSFGDPQVHGRISPELFVSLDHVAITTDHSDGTQDSSTLDALFVRAGVPYLREWGPLTLRGVVWLGGDDLSFDSTENGSSETFSRPTFPIGGRADLTRVFPWGNLRGGVDVSGGYLSHSEQGLGQPGDVIQQMNGTTSLWWVDAAMWADSRIDFAGDRLSVQPGVRVDHYGMTGEDVVDPRLGIKEQLTDWLVMRENLGRYHQPPTPGDLDPHGGNPDLKSSYFDQSSLGFDATLGDGWETQVTGYYNVGHDLGVAVGDTGPQFAALGALGPTLELLLEKQLGLAFYRENIGRALDRGVEVLIKRTTPKWFYMLGYTLAYADRTDNPAVLIGWRPFELDQRHNLNVIASRQVGNWRFGARVQLVSGMPYTPTVFPGEGPVVPYSANLPWFFQLDVRVDHRWHRSWGDINFYADIQNATYYQNVEGREPAYNAMNMGYEKDIPGLPIAPFIGVEWIPK